VTSSTEKWRICLLILSSDSPVFKHSCIIVDREARHALNVIMVGVRRTLHGVRLAQCISPQVVIPEVADIFCAREWRLLTRVSSVRSNRCKGLCCSKGEQDNITVALDCFLADADSSIIVVSCSTMIEDELEVLKGW
jgi:hypothetical protein